MIIRFCDLILKLCGIFGSKKSNLSYDYASKKTSEKFKLKTKFEVNLYNFNFMRLKNLHLKSEN
ncbi:hypothetical protein BpHYR1_039210 [Brachionus plicatilis]|uniref:Uncharacterized protein n=1 Tax=Brachionus plicatilis TaxID=10195 RepID=A0A3M7QWG4_BRAPC|nr:hypothetical protein BpHYR1_039210 [Brachionus plicatilis]